MADEAFALSPISARASLPSEEDYEAISHAFMETSRGRWFLGEYARRNRNADTRMVLEAVARIEHTVAVQKQATAETRLTEALAAIRRAVYEAQGAAAAAVQNLGLEQNLAPVRKGARIIREISWRWREIGADSRICDLLDSQVAAIDDACEKIGSTSPAAALIAAFDLIKARIAALEDSDRDAPPAAEAAATPSSVAPDATPVSAVENETSDVNDSATALNMPAEAVEMVETAEAPAEIIGTTEEAAHVTAEVADFATENPDEVPEAAGESPEASEAYDEALLDMIALEMAAPEPVESDDAQGVIADEIADDIQEMEAPAEPVRIAEEPEPLAAQESPAVQVSLQPSLEPPAKPVVEPSLGSTLLASGILHKPISVPSDPLAPIRRMSQAEKIAFFS